MKTQHGHTHTHCFPLLLGSAFGRYHHHPSIAQGHTAGKNRPRFLVTTLPALPMGPLCSLWHAPSLASRGHSLVVPLFPSPEPAAQALAWVTGKKAEVTGGRPYSGTCGHSSVRAMQTISLRRLQPLGGYPLLEREHQANLSTYHLPTHPFIFHANQIWASAPHHTDTRFTALNQTQYLPSSYLPSLGKTGE